MRVLLLSPEPDRSEQALYAGLERRGVELRLLSRQSLPQPFAPSSRFSLSAMRLIRDQVHEFSPDLIYSFTARALTNALLATRKSQVLHVAYRGTMGHLNRLDPSAHFSFLNHRVNAIVCVSEAVRRYLLSVGVPATVATTIYKGHDLQWYSGSTALTRTELGLAEDSFIVGCVANMRPVKGVDLLIQAMEFVPPSVELLLIGEMRDRSLRRCLERSSARPRIHHLGFRRDASEIIGLCNLVAMTSKRREGLPRSVIEGMSRGLPALVTAVGGMPELVTDGETGRVVATLTPKAIAQAITEFAGNAVETRRMGAAARERIRTHFSIEATIEQHLALFEALMGKSASYTAGKKN